jgi:hypothetical protein
MSVEELTAILIDSLKQVQEMCGRPTQELTELDQPIGGLAGFDSLNGIEVTMLVATRLKCDIPGDVNLFVSEDGRRALTVKEIAGRMKKLLPTDGNRNNARN